MRRLLHFAGRHAQRRVHFGFCGAVRRRAADGDALGVERGRRVPLVLKVAHREVLALTADRRAPLVQRLVPVNAAVARGSHDAALCGEGGRCCHLLLVARAMHRGAPHLNALGVIRCSCDQLVCKPPNVDLLAIGLRNLRLPLAAALVPADAAEPRRSPVLLARRHDGRHHRARSRGRDTHAWEAHPVDAHRSWAQTNVHARCDNRSRQRGRHARMMAGSTSARSRSCCSEQHSRRRRGRRRRGHNGGVGGTRYVDDVEGRFL
mmetsp:Transcript_15390/g.53452  ORF Transcript_15390/g.53452 Transcript_15390/m.53452 type:complete len:263 (+) Transcript_15390:698-1486(+)